MLFCSTMEDYGFTLLRSKPDARSREAGNSLSICCPSFANIGCGTKIRPELMPLSDGTRLGSSR